MPGLYQVKPDSEGFLGQVPDATAGLVAAGVRPPDDLDVVWYCNFPHPTPSAVPIKRAGSDLRCTVRTCIEIIQRCRNGENVPATTELPAFIEDELKDLYPELGGHGA